jgi:hypothetical protein
MRSDRTAYKVRDEPEGCNAPPFKEIRKIILSSAENGSWRGLPNCSIPYAYGLAALPKLGVERKRKPEDPNSTLTLIQALRPFCPIKGATVWLLRGVLWLGEAARLSLGWYWVYPYGTVGGPKRSRLIVKIATPSGLFKPFCDQTAPQSGEELATRGAAAWSTLTILQIVKYLTVAFPLVVVAPS